MADARAAPQPKLKVFISYSRKDLAFAEELLAGLELTGFAPSLDKHSIAAAEDWKKRLADLIEATDTVVFVITPDSIKSDICASACAPRSSSTSNSSPTRNSPTRSCPPSIATTRSPATPVCAAARYRGSIGCACRGSG